MNTETDHPFQVGVEVAVVSRGYGGTTYTLGKVAKVHKTGRFVLEGNAQQFRPGKDWHDKRWIGEATGGTNYRYRGDRVELVTDKLREEVAASHRAHRFKSITYTLDRESNNLSGKATEEQVAALERILSELRGGKSE